MGMAAAAHAQAILRRAGAPVLVLPTLGGVVFVPLPEGRTIEDIAANGIESAAIGQQVPHEDAEWIAHRIVELHRGAPTWRRWRNP